MEKVYVMDNRGHETEAFKIRYFEYGDANYFIYTLGEIDKDEYIKLYLKKIINDQEQIITENEWLEIKSMIQRVVKEIKHNQIISFKDLDMSKINEIMENNTRAFKLKKSIVEDLMNEESTSEEKIDEEPIQEEKTTDSFIESIEDTIKSSFTDEIAPKKSFEEIEEPKIKPIIIGKINKEERPISRVKPEIKPKEQPLQETVVPEPIIEKGTNQILFEEENIRLKQENLLLKKKLIQYREKLEQLKIIVKDI